MIRPAKQAFLESPHKDVHAKIVMTDSFQTACDYAMLAFMEELPSPADPSKGWDAHSQVCGARRVLDILKTLSQSPAEVKVLKPPTLNYGVK